MFHIMQSLQQSSEVCTNAEDIWIYFEGTNSMCKWDNCKNFNNLKLLWAPISKAKYALVKAEECFSRILTST